MMTPEVSRFAQKIRSIDDEDYGDFMRKANAYLMELEHELGPLADDKIRRKMIEMQTYIQYFPNWQVDLTKKKIHEDAAVIDGWVNSHHHPLSTSPQIG